MLCADVRSHRRTERCCACCCRAYPLCVSAFIASQQVLPHCANAPHSWLQKGDLGCKASESFYPSCQRHEYRSFRSAQRIDTRRDASTDIPSTRSGSTSRSRAISLSKLKSGLVEAVERAAGLTLFDELTKAKSKELCQTVQCEVIIRRFDDAQKKLGGGGRRGSFGTPKL